MQCISEEGKSMYKYFKINNFRCFEKLELPELERVNLIVGKNNVGKTALLEAIFVIVLSHFALLISNLNF